MLTSKKSWFNLPDTVTYLNGAYMSPQLKSVEQVGIDSLKRKNLPYEISAADFFHPKEILKKRFAELIGAPDHRNIAIIPSASYGLANVANNIPLKKGDEILIIDEQFPSNVYIWKKVALKQGASIKTIRPSKLLDNRGESWNEALLQAINSKTAVVAMPHVHWADGTRFDLEKIRSKTNEVQALLVIDGTQSVGALPFSIEEIRPDALICAGYKWLLGPYSLGLAYYSDFFNTGQPIEENWINRLQSEDFSRLTHFQDAYQKKAERYSVGESSNFILVPMLTRAIEQLLEWKTANIQDYCEEISRPAIEALRAKGHFIEADAFRAKHLFGIYLNKQIDRETVKQRLIEKNIYVSYRGAAIRISPNVYNSTADFDKLLSCF
ncbi:MAG: aminotransferase class V-fold PLP-dependent enzyme [Maribacter sp.]|nr:aminotransferase class V-fold PLP-dependent enzyme [Maribacter sp.]